MSDPLVGDLERDEGLRLVAYADPVSRGPPWTIGYGHTGREVHPGLIWTLAQAQTALVGDVALTRQGLGTALGWWPDLDPVRADALANMAFNLGVHGLLGFATFLGLMRAGSFGRAAFDLQHTEWAAQVGDRAVRIETMINTGERQ